MVKLAIRDDDFNAFTKVEDIKKAYEDIPDFPISFAVVPRVMDLSTRGACPETNGNTEPRLLSPNETTNYVKEMLQNGKADILLHGQTHRYLFIDGKRTPEMRQIKPMYGDSWEDAIRNERKYLEELFDYKINVFVAPSNTISKKNLRAVCCNGMDFSGIVPIGFERDFTLKNIFNFFKRWYYRATTGLQYPGILHYSDHKELNACVIRSYEYLISMYEFCEKHDLPMVINTHYWYLRDNENVRKMVAKFIKEAIKRGAVPSKLTDIISV